MDITVAIPTIPPRRKLLQRALDSVAVQTLPAVAISVAVDTRKQGAAATRQRALEAVRTGWVAFLDDDDEFMPNHLEALAQHAIETDADYVFSWYKVVARDRVYEHDPVFPTTHFTDAWDPAHPRQTTITTLVKTEVALSAGFQDPPPLHLTIDGQPWGEDWDFTLRCNKLGTISHLVEKTWYWHHDSGNTSGRPDRW